jgi:hypothetical protein
MKILSEVVEHSDMSTHEGKTSILVHEATQEFIKSLEYCKDFLRNKLWHLPDNIREKKVLELLWKMKEEEAKHHGHDFLKAISSYRNAYKFILNYSQFLPEGTIIQI